MPARKKRKHSRKRNSRLYSLSRGAIAFTLLLVIIIIGSALLVSGATPKNQISVRDPNSPKVIPDTDELVNPNKEKDNTLQLKTIKFKQCSETAAVSLQLDITGSMKYALNDLKDAVYTFTDQLSDDSVLGIQAYSSFNPRNEVIPVSLYKDIKDQIRPKVGALTSGGSTPTYHALQFSREILERAIAVYPERKFSYIFFSDGNPNVDPYDLASISQAAQGIKDLGVTVYAIGLQGSSGLNANIITAIASDPDKATVTTNSKELKRIYSEISTQLCGKIQ